MTWAGEIFSFVGDWGWIGGLVGGSAWAIGRFALGSPAWTRLALLAGLAFAAWWAVDEVQDALRGIYEDGRAVGRSEVEAANRAEIDRLRSAKADRDETIRIADEKIALLRDVLETKDRQFTERAVMEAYNEASKNPVCAPNAADWRLFYDAVDRLIAAAGGSTPVVQPAR